MPKAIALPFSRLDSYHGFYAFSAFLLAFPLFSQDPYILNIFIIMLTLKPSGLFGSKEW